MKLPNIEEATEKVREVAPINKNNRFNGCIYAFIGRQHLNVKRSNGHKNYSSLLSKQNYLILEGAFETIIASMTSDVTSHTGELLTLHLVSPPPIQRERYWSKVSCRILFYQWFSFPMFSKVYIQDEVREYLIVIF